MEERYGLYRQGSRALRSMRNGDFQEGDVWDVLNRREDYNSVVGSSMESSHFSPRRPPSAARMIGRVHGNSNPIHEPRVVQQSAPVKIPDWSKIYGENSKKASSNNASWLDNNDDEGDVGDGVLNEGDDSGDDDDDDTKLPPHEWLAKKYARSQISSFSVFEGVGRTLKGRDLSRSVIGCCFKQVALSICFGNNKNLVLPMLLLHHKDASWTGTSKQATSFGYYPSSTYLVD
ncbi:hypothetical protein AAG906_011757 [Vitis piasezkii]